jgi:hypothetical protein
LKHGVQELLVLLEQVDDMVSVGSLRDERVDDKA